MRRRAKAHERSDSCCLQWNETVTLISCGPRQEDGSIVSNQHRMICRMIRFRYDALVAPVPAGIARVSFFDVDMCAVKLFPGEPKVVSQGQQARTAGLLRNVADGYGFGEMLSVILRACVKQALAGVALCEPRRVQRSVGRDGDARPMMRASIDDPMVLGHTPLQRRLSVRAQDDHRGIAFMFVIDGAKHHDRLSPRIEGQRQTTALAGIVLRNGLACKGSSRIGGPSVRERGPRLGSALLAGKRHG